MARNFIIDGDTQVGYSYLLKKFYVVNKGTVTYRATVPLIRKVLDIVAPGNSITDAKIKSLETTDEVLTELYYTMHETGAYVASVQINDYDKFPIVLDCAKQTLYILNTQLNFNLTLNESRESRVILLCNFYKDFLGIVITLEEMTLIYNYLISMYRPYVYNVITDTATQPVTYSNMFAISNWNNKSKAVYNCTVNPYDTSSFISMADIVRADSSTNIVYTINNTQELKQGDTVYIKGTETKEETYTYTADGEYTVARATLNPDNTQEVILQEPLSATYNFPYIKAYVQLATTTIESISREEQTITLTESLSNLIQTGDIIEVLDTQQEIEGTTVSCNGKYTVAAVDNKTITVQETIPTSYNYTTGIQGSISKNMYIGDVISAVTTTTEPLETTLILSNKNPDVTLSPLQHIFALLPDTTRTYYVIDTVTAQDNITCITESYTGEEPLYTYTPIYPKLQLQTPDTNILIEVTSTQDEDLFPTTEFMVDTFAQCQAYISTYPGLEVPTEDNYSNVNNTVGGNVEVTGLPTMEYKGLFSQVYTTENA